MAALTFRGGFFKLFRNFAMLKETFMLPNHSDILLGTGVRYFSENSASYSQGKELNFVVSSLRVDRIAASGFGIGRRKMELLILAGKLYLNKNVVIKSSAKVKSEDVLELVTKQPDNTEDYSGKVCLSRLQIDDISDTLTKKGNLRISLMRQRNVMVERKFFEHFYKKKTSNHSI